MKISSQMMQFTKVVEGKTGDLIYPAGIWNETTTYEIEDNTRPYVMHRPSPQVDYEYYVLQKEYSLNDNPYFDTINNKGIWKRMTQFNSIIAKTLVAEYGLIGDAVFYNEYMFSQQGVNSKGEDSSDFKRFPYDYTPNLLLNFKTGESIMNNGVFRGVIAFNYVKYKDAKFIDGTEILDVKKNSSIYFTMKPGSTETLILPSSLDVAGFTVKIYNAGGAIGTHNPWSGWEWRNHKAIIKTADEEKPSFIVGVSKNNEGMIKNEIVSEVVIHRCEYYEFVAVPASKTEDGSELILNWIVKDFIALKES